MCSEKLNNSQYSALGDEQYILDMEMFIGKKSSYYLKQFNKIKAGDRIISWNWAGMIFGAYWFAYRKMYFYVAVYTIVETVNLYFFDRKYGITSYIFTVISALFGNYLYMKHIERNIEKYRNLETGKRKDYINRHKGTEKWAAVFVFIFALILFKLGILDGR